MPTDEEQIRELVKTWLDATKAGDIDTVLGLMTDDVLFILPGRSPMTKSDYADASRPQPGQLGPVIDGTSNILEITVAGDFAYMLTELSIKVTPRGGPPMERAGHTMSVLKRIDGRWLLGARCEFTRRKNLANLTSGDELITP